MSIWSPGCASSHAVATPQLFFCPVVHWGVFVCPCRSSEHICSISAASQGMSPHLPHSRRMECAQRLGSRWFPIFHLLRNTSMQLLCQGHSPKAGHYQTLVLHREILIWAGTWCLLKCRTGTRLNQNCSQGFWDLKIKYTLYVDQCL